MGIIGQFSKLDWARLTTQQFAYFIHLAFNFISNWTFDSETFDEKTLVAKGTQRLDQSTYNLPLYSLPEPLVHCDFRQINICSLRKIQLIA